MMTLVNTTSNDATFDLTTANGRNISVILNSGGSVGLDLSRYTAPYGLAVGSGGHSASSSGVSDEATVTVSDTGDNIGLAVT